MRSRTRLLFASRERAALNAPSASYPSGSENEHPAGGAKHEQGGQAHYHAAEKRARLVVHDLPVGGDDEDSDEEKWSENAVDDGAPEKRFHRIHVGKVQNDPANRRENDHRVKGAGRLKFFVEPLAPLKRFGERVGGGAGERRDRE